MNNQYVGGGGSTPLRGAGGGSTSTQPDEVRLNLSSVGAGVYGGAPRVPNSANNSAIAAVGGGGGGGVYYSTGMPGNLSIGGITSGGRTINDQQDNRSIASTPSKISKFTYSEYPQIRPTNPLYTSTHTIKTGTSAVSRVSTLNTVSRRQKYNPNKPRPLHDWRWTSALAVLLFFPTGLIALGLAIKAQTKFADGFIDEAKKLNKRAFAILILSFILAFVWILVAFFMIDKWPRTYG